MRTLLNSVYAGRPRYSRSIFLCQILVAAEALSTYAVLHYIAVQYFLIIERNCRDRRLALARLGDPGALPPRGASLRRSERRRATDGDDDDALAVQVKGDGDDDDDDDDDARSAPVARELSGDRDLLHTRDEAYDPVISTEVETMQHIFTACDRSGNGRIEHGELQAALRWYAVYLSPGEALQTIELFFKKNGRPIPVRSARNRDLSLTFDDFCEVMLRYDQKYRFPHSLRVNAFRWQPPSLQLDILARFLYLPLCAVIAFVIYLSHFGFAGPRG